MLLQIINFALVLAALQIFSFHRIYCFRLVSPHKILCYHFYYIFYFCIIYTILCRLLININKIKDVIRFLSTNCIVHEFQLHIKKQQLPSMGAIVNLKLYSFGCCTNRVYLSLLFCSCVIYIIFGFCICFI